jgi:hypothetical protein
MLAWSFRKEKDYRDHFIKSDEEHPEFGIRRRGVKYYINLYRKQLILCLSVIIPELQEPNESTF